MLTFRLPGDQLPGEDLFSKEMLKTQEVMDLVVGELLNAPKENIHIGRHRITGRITKRYKSRLAIQNSLPPIIVEVQLTANEPFMQICIKRLEDLQYISYRFDCLYRSRLSSPTIKPVTENPWVASLHATDFWAQSCFLVSKLTLYFQTANSESDFWELQP
jgi:hypothetical protein